MEAKEITISERTQNFIQCYILLRKCRDEMLKAMHYMYYEEQVSEFMDKEYDKVYLELEEIVIKKAMKSIDEHFGYKDFTEI